MELDELKGAWAQYDKKLSENLKFNEELLRNMNLGKAKQELQKPLNSEILNICIMFFTIVFVTSFSIRIIEDILFQFIWFFRSIDRYYLFDFFDYKSKSIYKN